MEEPAVPADAPANAPVPPPSRRARAFAFAGGGFDTAMQLGVAHALLVSRSAAPDYVAGISAGAINAAALAEILQAGQELPAGARRDVQVDTFRKFLTSFEEVPGELLRSILPDTFEINATRPLDPVQLPIHFDRERQGRNDANQARAGLIRLMNQVFEVRLPVKAITLLVNRVLHLMAAPERVSRASRLWAKLWPLVSIWFTGLRYLASLGATVGVLVWAALVGAPKGNGAGGRAANLIGGMRTLRLFLRRLRDLFYILVFAVVWIGFVPPVAGLALLWTLLKPPTVKRSQLGRKMLGRILDHYGISDGVGNSYIIKEQLIRCFDVHYYGETDIARVLEQALAQAHEAATAENPTKTLAWYQGREPRITVAPIAADIASGELMVLPSDVAVVDALLAATAIVPVFPAVKIASREFRPDEKTEKIFIDGLNVSNEPIGALIGLLRDDPDPHGVLAGSSIVDIYTVSDLANTGEKARYTGILEVAKRAFELQRFRDATMEQRYTDLYSRALPEDPEQARVTIGDRTYVRARVLPIGVERPVDINRQALSGQKQVDLHGLIEEAVADGCRAALEAMIPHAIASTAASISASTAASTAAITARPEIGEESVPCWTALQLQLGEAQAGLLAGSGEDAPGLPEICARCTLHRVPGGDDPAAARRLVVRPERQDWPEWPRQGGPTLPVPSSPSKSLPPIELTGWPVYRAPLAGRERPLVNFLFGGGVFRGVFHMGVMNGLNELGLMPDLVAGSSVGSILAAMIAQVFTEETKKRQIPIADLSATFLGIDQLVMTDRLADFVRGLTLRAADANFSARDLDLVLRRYDLDAGVRFGARGRRVVAGLERLFYLSPMQLSELVKAARAQDFGELKGLLQAALQEFFDRGGVGQEVLGAEPLALLIREEVIRGLHREPGNALFSAFAEHGIQFLATATNLTRGELEILGEPKTRDQASLLYGLLASSAFPAVFRPRQQWEMLRHATETDQYVDGGIIDNLPLDAVARFLDQASRGDRPAVARRPQVAGREVPHLLFTASLEVDKTCLDDDKAEKFSRNFLRLQKRARTFGYNRKIDAYAGLQRDLREIYLSQGRTRAPTAWTPLDLHVIAVRPRWLCNTFGFHPMLGFRRRKQAQSIAHGCASTIATFYHDALEKGHGEWQAAWGVQGLDAVEPSTVTSPRDPAQMELHPRRPGKTPGQCWFRNAPCPFSQESLAGVAGLGERKFLLAELAKVHEECGKLETHRSPADLARSGAPPLA